MTGWQAGIHTDNKIQEARISNINTTRIEEELENNRIVIIAGFQGINERNDISTLGRGGSDTTAVAIAAAINANHCYIFSDVDGVYSADPNKISDAKKIPEISYIEMVNLSDEGAKVLHNRCVEIAEKYNLKTYSDLRTCANELTFGAEYDFFEREDGYDALCKTYGFKFGKTMDMDIGLKYQALKQNKIDAMVIFTTDGQLAKSDVVVLEDDKQFYPSYLCGNVIRGEVLRNHPELNDVFTKLTGIITDSDMAQMNYEVETEGKEPRDVARAYLEAKGLLN